MTDRLGDPWSTWRTSVAAFLAMLEAPRELVHDEAFNVGRAKDNVQVRDIAEIVRAAVPGSTVSLAADAGPDLRDYRVDFSKLTGTFPELDASLERTRRGGPARAGVQRLRLQSRGLRLVDLRPPSPDS